jgi:hypothetical protein
LVRCDPSFPLWEWHRLLPQMEMTVNMLCTANATPTISAHTYLNGLHDYNKEPLAPLGCVMQCNVVPDEQTSFGPQSLYVWYIITSTENYLLYQPKPVNHPSCLNASLSGHSPKQARSKSHGNALSICKIVLAVAISQKLVIT